MTPKIKPIPDLTEDEFAQALAKLIKQHLADGKDPKALMQQGGLM